MKIMCHFSEVGQVQNLNVTHSNETAFVVQWQNATGNWDTYKIRISSYNHSQDSSNLASNSRSEYPNAASDFSSAILSSHAVCEENVTIPEYLCASLDPGHLYQVQVETILEGFESSVMTILDYSGEFQ